MSRWLTTFTALLLAGPAAAQPVRPKLTDAPVTHVVSQPPRPEPEVAPPPAARSDSTMGPLSVLTWGGRKAP